MSDQLTPRQTEVLEYVKKQRASHPDKKLDQILKEGNFSASLYYGGKRDSPNAGWPDFRAAKIGTEKIKRAYKKRAVKMQTLLVPEVQQSSKAIIVVVQKEDLSATLNELMGR